MRENFAAWSTSDKFWQQTAVIFGVGVWIITITDLLHYSRLAMALAVITTAAIVILCVMRLAADYKNASFSKGYRRFIDTTQQDTKYTEWETNTLISFYKGAVVNLCGKKYAAFIKHAPPHLKAPDDPLHPLRFRTWWKCATLL